MMLFIHIFFLASAPAFLDLLSKPVLLLCRKQVRKLAKSKYEYWLTEEGLLKLKAWARDGLIDEDIAANMGIVRSTLGEWKKNYPPIADALKEGKEVADIRVENALYKKATGYKYTEVTKEANSSGELVVTKTVTKEVQPDIAAQIFWLKNRKPDIWRDKQKVEVEGLDAEKSKLDELIKQMKKE